jgi:hypothetical protein
MMNGSFAGVLAKAQHPSSPYIMRCIQLVATRIPPTDACTHFRRKVHLKSWEWDQASETPGTKLLNIFILHSHVVMYYHTSYYSLAS